MAGRGWPVRGWGWPRILLFVVFAAVIAVGVIRASAPAQSAPQNIAVNGHRLLTETARSEACVHFATGRYTSNVDDLNLLAANDIVIDESANHLDLAVSAGSSGQSFLARVSGGGFDDYLQLSADVADQGGGPTVPLRCPFSKAKVERALKLGFSTQRAP